MSPKKETQADISKYEDNIKNYASQIQTLGSFVEAVRKVPGMYIGYIGNLGYLGCIREIFQNAIDEAVKKDSPCHYIKVTFDERNQMAMVEDTGRGIPHGMIIKIFSTQHTSSNYNKEPGDYSSGVHGVGSSVALALCKNFTIDSYQLGKAKRVEFTDGIPWKNGEQTIDCPKGRQGTTVCMTPAIDILGPITLTCKEVFDLVFKIFPLTGINDRIDFIGIDKHGRTVMSEELVNKDGILTELILRTQTPLVAPIRFIDDNGTTKAEIAFTYDSSDLTLSEDIISYSNFNPTTGGNHVQGFIDGLCTFFRNYMNKIYLGEKSKITIVNGDIKTGLRAIVVAAHLHPIFVGQAKTVLNNEDMGGFVRTLTYKSIEAWSKVNSNDLQKLCKYFKDVAEIRMKSDDNKIKLSTKYQTSLLTGKPKNYVQPSGNKELELFIVEGESAKGGAINSRDSSRQGIFPIRGKLPNAFTTKKSSFLGNDEVAAIITLIGGGYGKSFDISKVKWDKIICAADADADGSHINTLLLRFFLLYMPELISAGKLYRSVPPLYGIKVGKVSKYFINNIEYTEYIQGLFMKAYMITSMGGNKLTRMESTGLFVKNINYTYILEIISNTYAVDLDLLQDILFFISDCTTKVVSKVSTNANEMTKDGIPFVSEYTGKISFYKLTDKFNFTAFKKVIEKKYRFVKVDLVGGVAIINGLVNSKYQHIVLNDKFIIACSDILDIIDSNDETMYRINNDPMDLYKIMKLFEKMSPSGLTRFKGLGEQDPEELGDSVLLPTGSRTLMRYTIEDVKREVELIRYIDSNKSELLKDVKISRQDIE